MHCEITQHRRVDFHQGPLYALCVTDQGIFTAGADKQLIFTPHEATLPSQRIASFSESLFSIQVIEDSVWVGGFSGYCYQIQTASQKVNKWQAHEGPVFAIAGLSNGWMASGGSDGKIHIWDSASQQIIRSVWLGEFKIRSLEFIESQNELHVCCGDGSLIVLDLPWFNTRHAWKIKEEACYASAYFAAKNLRISAHKNGSIQFWQPTDTKPLVSIPAHLGAVYALQLDMKNNVLYSASHDKSLKIWNLTDLTLLEKWDHWEGQPYRSINKMGVFEDKIILVGDNGKIDITKICFFN